MFVELLVKLHTYFKHALIFAGNDSSSGGNSGGNSLVAGVNPARQLENAQEVLYFAYAFCNIGLLAFNM